MLDLSSIQSQAETHIAARRYGEAEDLYRAALASSPGCGEVHFFLGCLLIRAGRPVEARPHLAEATRLLPDLPEAHIVLGNTLVGLAQWDEAVTSLKRAADLRPDFLPVRINLALALARCGRSAEAEAVYLQIVSEHPENRDARINLTNILNEENRFNEAEAHARCAIELSPGDGIATNILGNALFGQGRAEEAEQAYRAAANLQPDLAQIQLNLFSVLRKLERFAEAEQAARRAHLLDPTSHGALDAVGLALIDHDRFDEAIAHLRAATEHHPESEVLLQHLAMAYSCKGCLEEAVTYGRKAVDLKPTPDVRFSLSLDQIRTGRWLEGWKNHEARPSASLMSERFDIPKWDGSRLEGGTLYVYSEGGLGDAIQFGRFIPLAANRSGARTIFECVGGGVELLSDLQGMHRIVPRPPTLSPPIEPVDACIGLMSLPALLEVEEATVPSALLPIRLPDAARAAWHERLTRLPGLRVGLCWSGGPVYGHDRDRSMCLDLLRPLAGIEGLSLVSLQIGPPADQIDACPELRLLHLPEELSPIGATAALIDALDLVISVDTSIAHLAGAMGKETWLLLPYVSHWVWNAYRPNDTPWYSSHRLFRQPRHKDWDSVVHRISRELAERVQSAAERGSA